MKNHPPLENVLLAGCPGPGPRVTCRAGADPANRRHPWKKRRRRSRRNCATARSSPSHPASSPSRKRRSKVGIEYVAVMASFPEELTAIEEALVTNKTKLAVTRIKGIEFKAAELKRAALPVFPHRHEPGQRRDEHAIRARPFQHPRCVFHRHRGRDRPGVRPGRRGRARQLALPLGGGVLQRNRAGPPSR